MILECVEFAAGHVGIPYKLIHELEIKPHKAEAAVVMLPHQPFHAAVAEVPYIVV